MSQPPSPRTAHIVGGGPAGLMAAQILAQAGVTVTVFERMPSPGRKFMLAGHGGLNLTHSEPRDSFVTRYGAAQGRIVPALDAFGVDDLREWSASLGQPTFVGTSGRVFPEVMRATPLMRAWLARLDALGVRIERRVTWRGWDRSGALLLDDAVAGAAAGANAGGTESVPPIAPRTARADVTIFALGGASWPHLGADGSWVELFEAQGVSVAPLRAANVGIRAAWTDVFASRFAGFPLKNVAVRVAGQDPAATRRGDAMVTVSGFEGGPIYALGAAIRAALDANSARGFEGCRLEIDLRPDLSREAVEAKLMKRRPGDSQSSWLKRTLALEAVSIGLLREAAGPQLPGDPAAMAALIKAVPVHIAGTMPIARAISSAGGILWDEVDETLMLKRIPGTFVAGEMLDWEAPTGGYLLQACFSMGVLAARGALEWLRKRV